MPTSPPPPVPRTHVGRAPRLSAHRRISSWSVVVCDLPPARDDDRPLAFVLVLPDFAPDLAVAPRETPSREVPPRDDAPELRPAVRVVPRDVPPEEARAAVLPVDDAFFALAPVDGDVAEALDVFDLPEPLPEPERELVLPPAGRAVFAMEVASLWLNVAGRCGSRRFERILAPSHSFANPHNRPLR